MTAGTQTSAVPPKGTTESTAPTTPKTTGAGKRRPGRRFEQGPGDAVPRYAHDGAGDGRRDRRVLSAGGRERNERRAEFAMRSVAVIRSMNDPVNEARCHATRKAISEGRELRRKAMCPRQEGLQVTALISGSDQASSHANRHRYRPISLSEKLVRAPPGLKPAREAAAAERKRRRAPVIGRGSAGARDREQDAERRASVQALRIVAWDGCSKPENSAKAWARNAR